MKPIVSRAIYMMLDDREIDPRMEAEFTEDGELTVEIVTGLQALSRDADLTKLMQMGEMVRNLPEPAVANFKWESYGRALISSLGFNPDNWIKSAEALKQEQMIQQQEEMAMQQQMMQQQGNAELIQQATAQELQQAGGQGVQELLENVEAGSPVPQEADALPPEIAQMMGGM